MWAFIQNKLRHVRPRGKDGCAADIPQPGADVAGGMQRLRAVCARVAAAGALALLLPPMAQAFDGNFSVTNQTIAGTGCTVEFVSQSSSGAAWVGLINGYDRKAGGTVWQDGIFKSYPTYTPPGYPVGLPLPGGPVTVADLQSCGLSNITNLAQNGADGGSRAADNYIGFSFRATAGGNTYDYVVAIQGATGTQIVNTRTQVGGPPTIVVNPVTVPAATVGVAYSQTMSGSGGTSPYSYAISAGTLPSGLSLATVSGAISGIPSNAGTFNFTVTARDNVGFSGSRAYSITVAPPVVVVSPPALPGAVVGAAYSQTLSASGGIPAYSYALTAGALPPGLSLSVSNGTLSGVPTATGMFTFTVSATSNSAGTGAPHRGSQAYVLTISAPTIAVAPATLPNPTIGGVYSQTLLATGGVANYGFAVTAGTLPNGLTLNSAGTVSGTPTAAGTFNFTIIATDSSTGTGPYTGSRAYTVTVAAPALTLTPSTLPNGAVATSYSQAFTTTSGTAVYSYAVTAGALPPGLTLSTNGQLSGTPTAGGSFNFTVRSTDSSTGTGAPFSVARAYTLVIGAPTITVTPGTLSDATVSRAYSQALAASGGIAGYRYAVSAGALPAGLVLSQAGVLSGTPTTGGTFNFTVTATDSSTGSGPFTGARAYTLTVNKAVQTLTFPAQALARHTFAGGGSFPINPLATSDSPANPARPITYSSLAPAVCSVSGTTVSMVAPGVCTLAANQAGDAAYDAAAQATQTVAIDGIKTFSGTTVPGTGGAAGPASASFTGGGAACSFDAVNTGFVAGVAPPVGQSLPQGMFRFRLTACDPGSTVTMTVTWPQAMSDYGKYGPATVGATSDSWFTPPGLDVTGNTATFTITDGGVGDSDAAAGVIADPTGPLAASAAPVPALGEWAMLMVAGLLGALGLRRLRKA